MPYLMPPSSDNPIPVHSVNNNWKSTPKHSATQRQHQLEANKFLKHFGEMTREEKIQYFMDTGKTKNQAEKYLDFTISLHKKGKKGGDARRKTKEQENKKVGNKA